MASNPPLPSALVERVLERLGLSAVPATDRAGLRHVYRAWCERVPFDNLLKRIHVAEGNPGPLPGDDPVGFFESWLAWGTGGTCWAGNGALCALLEALGFEARRGLATMMIAPDLPPNHGTVIVELDGVPTVVDASILHAEPLPLPDESPTRIEHPAWGVDARREAGLPVIRWRPLHLESLDCRIDAPSSTPEEFRRFHEATRAWSPFNFSVSLRVLRDDGVIGMAFGQRAEIGPDGATSLAPCTPAERTGFLVDAVGIDAAIARRLPPDEPLPPPPKPAAS